tara:strand:- start:2217 stop:2465 length:249 start_codon:yes stop_codon:yes gene_type:complete
LLIHKGFRTVGALLYYSRFLEQMLKAIDYAPLALVVIHFDKVLLREIGFSTNGAPALTQSERAVKIHHITAQHQRCEISLGF